MASLAELNLDGLMKDAITDVFSTMLSLELQPAAVSAESKEQHVDRIVGSVGFAGSVKGNVYLHLTLALAKKAASTMMGIPAEELGDAETVDVVAELTNMVGGSFKSRLSDAGFSCKLSVPSVLRGQEFQISPPAIGDGRLQEQHYQSEAEAVRLVVIVKKDENEA